MSEPGLPADATAVPPARGLHVPRPGSAVCHRCGGSKKGPFVPCKSCGYAPVGPERQIAWLFSEHHLQPQELDEAARRIHSGERPDPPRALLERARIQMGAAPLTDDARTPLGTAQLIGLAVGNVLLTPLLGLSMWWGMREERPIAAAQALRTTLPVVLGMAVVWGGLIARWTLF